MSEMNLNKLTKEELIARLEAAEAAAKPANEVVNNDPNRRVKVYVDIDKHNNEPLHVSVNDYSAIIRRGEWVEVPYFVAKHMEEMKAQENATIKMIKGLSGEWERRAR